MAEGSKSGLCSALKEKLALARAPRLLRGLERLGGLLQREPLACTQKEAFAHAIPDSNFLSTQTPLLC